ncbi:hypothetical protein [Micromonospora sp. HM5-17]|uniref:hypothetical protein n=1 Tax=Micromonospora sp. HM5-17 TaxID=2487710 RepID=UPI000F46973A|nr:hypothetical protein [Micromonospora sp. HM5-17]ROT33509.1 hypothetical protein EF879_00595 [Micromonospora sp. HM5-17]
MLALLPATGIAQAYVTAALRPTLTLARQRALGGHAMTRTRTGALLLSALFLLAACAEPSAGVDADPSVPMTTPTSAPPVPAGPVLIRLADTLADAPADSTIGGYQYIERRTWYRDIIGPPGPTGWPARVRIDQLWRTDDAVSGRQVSVRVAVDGCTPDGGESRWTGRAADPFDQPPPSTPADLLAHLLTAAGPEQPRPEHIVGGVAMLYERQALARPVRAALLRLLAAQPGLLVRTGVTDRIHRPGTDLILPYTDQAGVPRRDILTIDATTGVLLAAFTTIAGPIPPQDPQLGADAREAIIAEADSYRLYVDSRRTPDIHTPAAGCQHPAAKP